LTGLFIWLLPAVPWPGDPPHRFGVVHVLPRKCGPVRDRDHSVGYPFRSALLNRSSRLSVPFED
jgi:hypothetical protein